MKALPFDKLQGLSLQFVLIVPFVLQIFGAVGLVGYLSLRNGQQAVNELSDQLMARTSRSVDQHLTSYLSIPHRLSQMNADAVQVGLLNVRDRQTVGKYFWRQMQTYDLTYLGIGLTTGEGVGAARYDGKTVTIEDWGAKLPNNVSNYATDTQGNRTRLNNKFDYNNFKESWYTEPVKAGKPTWSRIYTWNSPFGSFITASAGQPIYDVKRQLLGMVSADIHLLKISEFLQNLDATKAGQVFILERSGLLIANSGKAQPFKVVKNEVQRLNATDSPDPTIQAVAQQLQQRFHGFGTLANEKLQIDLQGERHHVRVAPWRDQYGLDWLVVVSVPESAFMSQINANTRTTLLLCLAALAGATLLGFYTSRWITRPILRLSAATRAIAAGDLDQRVEAQGIQELSSLSLSFNEMAGQLRDSFNALEESNTALEHRVDQRTHELSQNNRQLQTTLKELHQTQTQMVQSEKMSALGQMVAGVAHEINNPVNFIHGNLNHVEEYTQELVGLLQRYQSVYPQPPQDLQAAVEDADLAFLLTDLVKMLQSMKVGTERIREIVLSLRNFSRLDEAEFKAVDIHEGIENTLVILRHRFKARAERPEIQVVRDYGPLPLVECYAGQLNQVFMNILSNAIDAFEEANQGQSFEVIAAKPNTLWLQTAMTDQGTVQIIIADNGPGIAETVRTRLFNPFFTTKAVGKGTGLGLSISYQIITEKHGGRLSCHSTPGQGAKFIIEIPIQQATPVRSQLRPLEAVLCE
ncbi:HAMP domain-containing protein [Leptolyngbya sp. FACHB-321]|uniref:ATP-binding protein n=1 Tax=Leptolyngbya sp. FACHB-321 TaxID=2692807 RepID=UPI00168803B6|nr:ATP-binding protein [Leptolyngbya sp. FACHB-321]MBD2038600.1 HAMP domain-containing protein [Leptolyngbya sp. FACHB-321]